MRDKRKEIRTKSKLKENLINIRKILPSQKKKRFMTLTWWISLKSTKLFLRPPL